MFVKSVEHHLFDKVNEGDQLLTQQHSAVMPVHPGTCLGVFIMTKVYTLI